MVRATDMGVRWTVPHGLRRAATLLLALALWFSPSTRISAAPTMAPARRGAYASAIAGARHGDDSIARVKPSVQGESESEPEGAGDREADGTRPAKPKTRRDPFVMIEDAPGESNIARVPMTMAHIPEPDPGIRIPPGIRVRGILRVEGRPPVAILLVPGFSDSIFVREGETVRIEADVDAPSSTRSSEGPASASPSSVAPPPAHILAKHPELRKQFAAPPRRTAGAPPVSPASGSDSAFPPVPMRRADAVVDLVIGKIGETSVEVYPQGYPAYARVIR